MWRRKLFRSRNISIATKMRVFQTIVMFVLLYGAETWAVVQQDTWKFETFQMRCLRDILVASCWNVLWKELGSCRWKTSWGRGAYSGWSISGECLTIISKTADEMLAIWQEETTRRSITTVERSSEQGPLWNKWMAGADRGLPRMACCNPPTKLASVAVTYRSCPTWWQEEEVCVCVFVLRW